MAITVSSKKLSNESFLLKAAFEQKVVGRKLNNFDFSLICKNLNLNAVRHSYITVRHMMQRNKMMRNKTLGQMLSIDML